MQDDLTSHYTADSKGRLNSTKKATEDRRHSVTFSKRVDSCELPLLFVRSCEKDDGEGGVGVSGDAAAALFLLT